MPAHKERIIGDTTKRVGKRNQLLKGLSPSSGNSDVIDTTGAGMIEN